MKAQIKIVCDGDWDNPEVQISGTSNALAAFGSLLNTVNEPIVLNTLSCSNEYYPVEIKNIIIIPMESGGDRLTVVVDEVSFKLSGTNKAFEKLGDSLVNFFDSETSIGEHFQLYYYDGNQILNKTNCNLIFICD